MINDPAVADVVREDTCLGRGSFGAVYLGFDASSGRQVAIKELPLVRAGSSAETMTAAELKAAAGDFPVAVQNEIDIMREAVHPNLVHYYGSRVAASEHEGPVVQLVMEYVPGGSVARLLGRVGKLREPVAAMYTRDVLRGLQFLHDTCRVCHRDVKSENVLVTPEGECKLTDYGASKALIDHGRSAMLSTCIGTPNYMAPEVFRGEPYNAAADVWSAGCLLVELLTGDAPNYGMKHNPMAMMYHVASDDDAVPTLPDDASVSDACRDFLAAMVQRDAPKRLTARALLQHPWMRSCAVGRKPADRAAATDKARSSSALFEQSKTDFFPGVDGASEPIVAAPCHRCGSGIALFTCDQCRQLEAVHRLCPTCWDTVHAHARATSHVKKPLLMVSPERLNASDGKQKRSPPPSSQGSRRDTDAGLMLPSGEFVDMYVGDETVWECGRCGVVNDSGALQCTNCEHTK